MTLQISYEKNLDSLHTLGIWKVNALSIDKPDWDQICLA